MEKYFYFWTFFISVRAVWHGYENYKENRDAGYNKIYFERTGRRVIFHGGLGEAISCTIAASFGLILSPFFILIETAKSLPAMIVLYFIS